MATLAFRPVCSTVTGRDLHPLDPIKKFHRLILGSSSSKLSQRDNNVGSVKHFRAHYSMHSKKSAISLSLKMCPSNQGSLAISFRSGTQSDPCISSVELNPL